MMKKGIVVITEASTNLGEAFARKLASRGNNLLLIGRKKKRLDALANELEFIHNIRTEVIKADLSENRDMLKVEKKLSERDDIKLLVNNAGFGMTSYFSNTTSARIREMLNLHVLAFTRLIKAVLPQMMRKNKGAIINLSSIAAFVTTPLVNPLYGSTKAYIVAFSKALFMELKEKGHDIKIQALCPGFTKTSFYETEGYRDFNENVIPKWLFISNERIVEDSLNALKKNKAIVIPGKRNRFFLSMVKNKFTFYILKLYYGKRIKRKISIQLL